MKPSILVVDDEKNARDGLRTALEPRYEVYVADSANQAVNVLESENIDLILTDLRMAGEDGLALIRRARTLPHRPVCILMTAYGSVETAVQAMKQGASDYLTKPLNLDEVDLIVARHLQARKTEHDYHQLKRTIDSRTGTEDIIGRSRAMTEVLDTVRQIAPSRASVLILGESGTGKELVARAIHRLSSRRDGPLVAVHCAALTSQLLESELFGHEKGAFTGAVERRIGRFEAADGGTIFLDEIGEIDPSTQVKILRVLGERAFERVGSTKTLHVDVRLVAATNKDLRILTQEGRFRDDLYYRLNVVQIVLPPLREHREDIPLLVKSFLAEFNRENRKNVSGFAPDAMDRLLAHDWPGNVRELRAAVEHAVVLARGDEAGLRDLPTSLTSPGVPPHVPASPATGAPPGAAAPSGGSWEDTEKALITQALLRAGGNRSHAAESIGMSRRTLHRKLKLYGLERVGLK